MISDNTHFLLVGGLDIKNNRNNLDLGRVRNDLYDVPKTPSRLDEDGDLYLASNNDFFFAAVELEVFGIFSK